ncbi:MAG: DUF2807 domain-containing protein [Bacteroidales bacterium]
MKTISLKFAFFILCVFFTFSCGTVRSNFIYPSGSISTRTFNNQDFSQIQAGNAFIVKLIPGDKESIYIEADNNLMPYISVKQEKERLELGFNKEVKIKGNLRVVATVTYKTLNSLKAFGATNIYMPLPLITNNLTVTLSGASSLEGSVVVSSLFKLSQEGASSCKLDVEAKSIKAKLSGASIISDGVWKVAVSGIIALSGASSVNISGFIHKLELTANGASQFKNQNLLTNITIATLSGASNALLSVDNELRVKASGASMLSYQGEPNIKDVSATGASSVSRKK